MTTFRGVVTTVALYSAVVPGQTAKTCLPGGNSGTLEESFLFGKGMMHDIGSLYFLKIAMTEMNIIELEYFSHT